MITVTGESDHLIDGLFQSASGKKTSEIRQREIAYGHWRSTAEDVVLIRVGDRIEIHCHGGQAAPAAILKSLTDTGITELSQSDFAHHFTGEREESWLSENWLALPKAATARTAEYLLAQLNTASQWIEKTKQLPVLGKAFDRTERLHELESAIQHQSFGLHLTKPWSVVLCGRPNVGKSSLINAIAGFDRAIVHETPGTTRDVVTQHTAVDGWPIELKDTAGLRITSNTIEQQGIEYSQIEIQNADLVVAVVDALTWSHDPDRQFIRDVGAQILVLNKIDKLQASPSFVSDLSAPLQTESTGISVIATSATEGTGIRNLIQEIAKGLVPDPPDFDQLFPVSETQAKNLQAMFETMEREGEI